MERPRPVVIAFSLSIYPPEGVDSSYTLVPRREKLDSHLCRVNVNQSIRPNSPLTPALSEEVGSPSREPLATSRT